MLRFLRATVGPALVTALLLLATYTGWHWRDDTQGIEARQGGTGFAVTVHESPVGAADAPEPQSDTPS